MILYEVHEINFTLIIGVFVGFSLICMLRDTVVKLSTFVKGLNLI